MFKFNFNLPEHTKPSTSDLEEEKDDRTCLNWTQPSKYEITADHLQRISDYRQSEEVEWSNTVTLKYMNCLGLKNFEETVGSFPPSLLTHSDLLPSVYEGGFKIWECTWDLLKYVKDAKFNFKDKRVLELGCGAGLPGIAAAVDGAAVSMQDYNLEVLERVTIPNILLNFSKHCNEETTVNKQVKFLNKQFTLYHGDWGNLDQLIFQNSQSLHRNFEGFLSNNGETRKIEAKPETDTEAVKFDFILTSETIYNRDCQPKLLRLFTNCLKADGLIILAAKSHYFGVGGGTYEFIKLVKREGNFDINSTVCHNEGVQREILTLKWKKK